MKILILNGSPRQGNTVTAIEALKKGIASNHEVEVINTYDLKIEPCKACGACGCQGDCIDNDDTNAIVDKVLTADLIVFASPVYWCGISGQLKLVLDKFYAKHNLLQKKKTACIITGAEPVSHPLYDAIMRQFEYNEEYLEWESVFKKAYSAGEAGDLAANKVALEELEALGETL